MNNNCVSNNWVHFQTEEMEDREEHFKYTSQNYKKMVQVNQHKDWRAHGAMLLAMVLFGLMATFSKDVLTYGGITGPQLVAFRICGAAMLFWLGSLIVPQQRVERRDLLRIVGASIFGFVMAQGGYIVGLSLTSPINATIELTTMPIFTLILSSILLHERITPRRALGIIMGFTGAVLLITRTASAATGKPTDFRGDLLILPASSSCPLPYPTSPKSTGRA